MDDALERGRGSPFREEEEEEEAWRWESSFKDSVISDVHSEVRREAHEEEVEPEEEEEEEEEAKEAEDDDDDDECDDIVCITKAEGRPTARVSNTGAMCGGNAGGPVTSPRGEGEGGVEKGKIFSTV